MQKKIKHWRIILERTTWHEATTLDVVQLHSEYGPFGRIRISYLLNKSCSWSIPIWILKLACGKLNFTLKHIIHIAWMII